MTYLTTKKAIALWAILFALVAAPQNAAARGSIHLELPHISLPHISFGQKNYHRSKQYRNNRDRYYYRKGKRAHKRYNRNYYNNNSYYQPRSNYYNRGYSSQRYYDDGFEYCPSPAYSLYNDPSRNCQVHGEHFHCEG